MMLAKISPRSLKKVMDERKDLLEIYKSLHHFMDVFMTPDGTLLADNEYIAFCGVTSAVLNFEEKHLRTAQKTLAGK
jgi:hypothetical protein